MRKYIKFTWLMGTIIFTICVACLTGFSKQTDEEFERRIMAIRRQTMGKRVTTDWQTWERVEAQLLDLIKDYNLPAEKGKIYSTIARAFSQSGWRLSSEDPRIPKAIKYCKEALQHPLDVIDGCYMYGTLTDALLIKYRRRPEEEFVKIRQEAITYCLTGLKLALDCNAPKEYPESPGRMTVPHILPQEGPIYEEAMRKYKEQLAARKKWDFLEKLYFQRKALTQMCVTLYSHKPYDIDEFKLNAEKILKGHEDATKELIAQVEAEIKRLTQREEEIRRIEKGDAPAKGNK